MLAQRARANKICHDTCRTYFLDMYFLFLFFGGSLGLRAKTEADPTSHCDVRWQTGGRAAVWTRYGFRFGSVRFGLVWPSVWSYLKFLVVTFLSTISFRLNSLPFFCGFLFSVFFHPFFFVFCFEMHVINSFHCGTFGAVPPSRVGVKKYQNITSNKCWIRHNELLGPNHSSICLASYPRAQQHLVELWPKFFTQLVTGRTDSYVNSCVRFRFRSLWWALFIFHIFIWHSLRVTRVLPRPQHPRGEMPRQSGRSFKKQ